jgi:hypothetical protein
MVLSWPLLALVAFLTSTEPAEGQRWADANPGRGALLAAVGLPWMTAILLVVIWKLVFSVLLPRIGPGRRNE